MGLTLKKMVLSNIGIHKQLEIVFGEFTEIVGKNATGKTTVEKAIMELLDGRQKHILNNKEVDGAIVGEFTGDTKILVPFRRNETLPVKMIYKGAEITSPKKKLREINTSSIRAIDFFDGEGVGLNKMQTEILLSLLNIKLDSEELKSIAGEIPNPEDFEKLHPLDYINSLTKEPAGYYYKKRHDNNEKIRTFEQTERTMSQEIGNVLHANGESFDKFNTTAYKDISLSDMIGSLRSAERDNDTLADSKRFLDGWEKFYAEKKSIAEQYIESSRANCESEFSSKIKSYSDSILSKKEQIKLLEREIEQLEMRVEEVRSSHSEYTAKIVASARSKAEETLKKYESVRDSHQEILKKIEFKDVTDSSNEIRRIENIKGIVPAYMAYKENQRQYEEMKDSSDKLTEIIDNIRRLPKELLKRSEMPIKGLSVNNDGEFTMINSYGEEVLISQLSGTERLKLSLDVSIARLGEVKLLIIPDWHDVDAENKIIIKQTLKDAGVQGVAICKEDNVETLTVRS